MWLLPFRLVVFSLIILLDNLHATLYHSKTTQETQGTWRLAKEISLCAYFVSKCYVKVSRCCPMKVVTLLGSRRTVKAILEKFALSFLLSFCYRFGPVCSTHDHESSLKPHLKSCWHDSMMWLLSLFSSSFYCEWKQFWSSGGPHKFVWCFFYTSSGINPGPGVSQQTMLSILSIPGIIDYRHRHVEKWRGKVCGPSDFSTHRCGVVA